MILVQSLLDFHLPLSCSFCRSSVGDSSVPYFCSTCWNDFFELSGPVCPSCGRPLDSPEALLHRPEHRCLDCGQSSPLLDQAVSVGQFEGPLREAINQFKYRPSRSLGKPLGDWMAKRVRLLTTMDMVMPVPLHIRRLRQRGFNQTLLLAHRVSACHGIPLSYDNLARVRPTKPQAELRGNVG